MFPILKMLIKDCPNLMPLPQWVSKFKSLERLGIRGCPNLTSLPNGISCLTSLQKLIIVDCPSLEEKCQKGIGEVVQDQARPFFSNKLEHWEDK